MAWDSQNGGCPLIFVQTNLGETLKWYPQTHPNTESMLLSGCSAFERSLLSNIQRAHAVLAAWLPLEAIALNELVDGTLGLRRLFLLGSGPG